MRQLQRQLTVIAFFNFFLVAALGLLLRASPFLSRMPYGYKNLLHAHSHFAFGGWIMPALVVLIFLCFPDVKNKVGYIHWRNIALLLLLSAYGMLFSFPVQGYAAVSISFSTISILAGFYMAVVIWAALRKKKVSPAHLFLKWGLVYLCISSLGPFATGPLIVMGQQGQPIYFNAIYFFLHFQYNGWFTFAVLAACYSMMQRNGAGSNGLIVFKLMNAACLPAFVLSLLWNQPGLLFNIVGGGAALLQLIPAGYLFVDFKKSEPAQSSNSILLKLALAAFVLKVVLQAISAFPAMAQLAYQNRNLVIAYLHLSLLGFISITIMSVLIQNGLIKSSPIFKTGFYLFLFSFVITEALLVLDVICNLAQWNIANKPLYLFICSIPYPVGIFCIFLATQKREVLRPFIVTSAISRLLQHD